MKSNKDLEKLRKGADDFKRFISRGNVVDMAVGVIIGSAFGKIVSSLVNDIIMPFIGIILGGMNFTELSIKVGEATIKYGTFIQTIFDFLVISFCIFIMIKLFEKFKNKESKKEENLKKSADIILLEEIRDLLKENK